MRSLDEIIWHRFVVEHPAGNIFHTPEMFRVFAQAKGYEPSLWAVVSGNNSYSDILALMLPVQVTVMGGLLHRLTTRAVLYGSVLCKPGEEGKKALAMLLQAYQREVKNQVLFTELRNLSDLSELQPVLTENGFIYEAHLNYLINLNQSIEEVLQNIGKRTRKKIRQSLRDRRVRVTEVTERAKLDHWYDTLRKTYHYARIPLADRSLFEAAFDQLYSKGMVKFLLAEVNGVAAACSVELLYKNTIYGWYGGLDRNHSKFFPNEMLMWHILEWGASHGYCIYDFGGAGRPGEEYGVRDFKAKFGGELVSFGRNIYVHAPLWLKLSELGYAFYRKLVL